MKEQEKGEEMEMRRSVKQLHFGLVEEKEEAAAEIKRLASRDLKTRKALAELGVIPTLVSMLVAPEEDSGRRRVAVEALVELANGTFTNKALIVEAGLLTKLPQIINTEDLSIQQELATLLLSISSLSNTQFPVPLHATIPFLIRTLNSHHTDDETKIKCLATLQNLSTKIETIKLIVSSGLVHTLLTSSLTPGTSAVALATLSNLVLSSIGKKAIEDDAMVPEILVDIMAWENEPRCQELVAYILMVLAHGSATQRKKMKEMRIVPLLLEVAMLGSQLAQKRALKILQWFKDERQSKMNVHSGPQSGRLFSPSDGSSAAKKEGKDECKRDVRRMVRQSLDQNMESMARRANNASQGCSGLKSLVASSSSKSL